MFKCERGSMPWLGKIEGERIYNPIGDTDSEKIFCAILNALKAKFSTLPSLPLLHAYLQELLEEIVEEDKEGTILNFLLGCGQYVQFAYSWPGSRPNSNVWNGLHYTVREPPFKKAALVDCNYEVDFAQLAGEDARVALITTKPLTINEEWIEFERGDLIMFDTGIPHLSPKDSSKSQHMLESDYITKGLEEDQRRFNKDNDEAKAFVGGGI